MNDRKTTLALIGACTAFMAAVGAAGVQPLGSDFDHNTGLMEYIDSDLIERVEARNSTTRDLIARHADRAGIRLIEAPIKMIFN